MTETELKTECEENMVFGGWVRQSLGGKCRKIPLRRRAVSLTEVSLEKAEGAPDNEVRASFLTMTSPCCFF